MVVKVRLFYYLIQIIRPNLRTSLREKINIKNDFDKNKKKKHDFELFVNQK